jgi:iron complex outermembrane receptor protein
MPLASEPRLRAVALAALLLAAGTAHAQAPAPADAVVITASGSEARAFDTPYAVGVVDAEALRAAGPLVNLSEVLTRIPGIVANNRNNYAQDLQISSRGFGARASFGIRGLRLYSDGIPASGPDGQGQVSHFDLAGAQRVEVLRGPFSALYGSSSGGVISLVSSAPTERRWFVSGDAGSDGLKQARIGVEAPLGNGLSIRASASRFEIDGFRPQSSAERTLANVRLGWEGARDRVVVVLNSLDQPALDPLGLTPADFALNPDQTAGVALPQDAPGQAFRYNTRKNTRQDQAGVSWRHRFADAGALQDSQVALYAGRRSVTQWQSIPDSVQTASQTHPGGVIDFDRSYQGVDARLRWRWALEGDRTLQLVAGASADTSAEDRRGFRNFVDTADGRVLGVTGERRRDERNRVGARDLYAQGELDLARDWTATLGLRRGEVEFRSADRFIVPGANPGDPPLNGDDSGSFSYSYTSPVAALQWRAAPTLNVYLSTGRGFESPTFNEVAYRAAPLTGMNSDLRAQTSRQWELGAKWRLGRDVALDAALFDIRTTDEIGVLSSSGGRTVFQNVGPTRRQGAELDLRWRLASTLSAQIAATWLDATYRETRAGTPIVTGNRIAGTVRSAAYAELAWQAYRGAEFALEGRAQSDVAANDANTVFAPGYGMLALRARWQLDLGPGKLELLGRVDNLDDRRVVSSVIVNEGNQRFFEPSPGRTWLVSARWSAAF